VLGDVARGPYTVDAFLKLGLLAYDKKTVEDGTIVQLELYPTVRWYAAYHRSAPDESMERRYGQVYRALASRIDDEFNRSMALRTLVVAALPDFEHILQSPADTYLTATEIGELAGEIAGVYTQRGQPRRA